MRLRPARAAVLLSNLSWKIPTPTKPISSTTTVASAIRTWYAMNRSRTFSPRFISPSNVRRGELNCGSKLACSPSAFSAEVLGALRVSSFRKLELRNSVESNLAHPENHDAQSVISTVLCEPSPLRPELHSWIYAFRRRARIRDRKQVQSDPLPG